jgi:hypothetical protein
MSAKRKPVPEIGKWGFLSEYFLVCGKDGIVRVKDGRTLEEYINDPRIVRRRKKHFDGNDSEMVLFSRKTYEKSLIPHVA